MEYKAVPILEQNVGDDRVVKSIFAVMGNIDGGGDRLHKGAFAKTLQERLSRVKVLWQHSSFDPPIGVPVSIREIGKGELPKALKDAFPEATGGLLGEVRYLDTPRGNEILAGIKSGAITENSIGYDPVKVDFEPHPDGEKLGTVRNLRECKLWDISPVNWGMNEATCNVKAAIPFAHHPLADEGAAWDGPAQVSAADTAQLKAMCAWYDSANADVKSAYKLPHHTAEGCQTVWRGVAAAMGRLLQAGTDIPDGDRKGVYTHLSHHYEEFSKTPPDFKTVELVSVLASLTPEQYKVGRVLSAANIDQLKAAIDTLQKLLQAAEPPTDDVGKALTAQAVRSTLLRLQFAERAIL